MGTKKSGYSILNLLMDLIMVVSIVVFLNVSLKLVPDNEMLSSILPYSTNKFSNKYTPDILNQKTAPVSSNTKRIQIQIGEEAEQEMKLPSYSVPLYIRQAVYNVAAQKRLISEETTVETINIPEVIRATSSIKTYINGDESPYVRPKGFVHNDAFPYDISLTTIVPISQLDSILKLTSWSGPVHVCVYASKQASDRDRILQFAQNKELHRKIVLVVVYSDLYDVVYPVNTLKNLAISTLFTTHFIMIDHTMVPSDQLYDKLRKIPVSVLYEPIHLVTIPVFYGEDTPASRKNVISCIDDKKCLPKYLYMDAEWYSKNTQGYYMRPMECMEHSKNYYFMRRYNSFLQPYDEQIVTRGYDDISLIQYLIKDGYVFHILQQGYFLDTTSAIDMENDSLQLSKEIQDQFELYRRLILSSNGRKVPSCTKKTDWLGLSEVVEYSKMDVKIRKKEINQLKNVFEQMYEESFDINAWQLKIKSAATICDKRMRSNI